MRRCNLFLFRVVLFYIFIVGRVYAADAEAKTEGTTAHDSSEAEASHSDGDGDGDGAVQHSTDGGDGVHDEEGDGSHEEHSVYAVVYPWVVQAVGIVVYFILTRYVHVIPYTAVMFILGIFMGMGASQSHSTDILSQSIRMWVSIDSETLFTVFLPGLLFKDALEIK